MSYIDQLDDFMKEKTERDPVYDWRLLYPDLDVRDWEIRTDHRGVFGRRVRGDGGGMVAFYVPRGWRPESRGKEAKE